MGKVPGTTVGLLWAACSTIALLLGNIAVGVIFIVGAGLIAVMQAVAIFIIEENRRG